MTEPRALTLVTDASRMLAEARSLDDIRHVHNLAQRAHDYAKAARLGLDAQNSAAAIRLEAEARAGELLIRMEKEGQRRAKGQSLPHVDASDMSPSRLDDLGVTRDESSAWQAVARVPAERRAEYISQAQAVEAEVTRAGLLKFATAGRLAPMMTSDNDEWTTPRAVIANVVGALGVIDLDPCAEPARAVPAATHLTRQEDGLAHGWSGRVFANPPYSQVERFAAKVAAERGNIDEAIILVPSRTETRWWREIPATAVCFFHGRLRFGDAEQGAPFPSAALYVGPDPSRFARAFADVGLLYERIEP